MTRWRAVLPERVVAEQKPFFVTLGGPKAHDSSVEKHSQEGTAEPQISPLRSPGFPVETRGFDDLHAALFTESRTRGRRQQREVGNPGQDDKGRGVAQVGVVAGWEERTT